MISQSKEGLLKVIVFLNGCIIMVFELLGSRMAAPFFGTSIFIWTNLIGIVLGSLALGYYLGGRLADRYPYFASLAKILFLAGLILLMVGIFYNFVFINFQVASNNPALSSFCAGVVIFFPVNVLLGMVAPLAVRISTMHLENLGRKAGSLYALSTLGSIVGTFLAGFVLIPTFGIRELVFGLGFILVVLSLLASERRFYLVKIITLIIVTIIYFTVSVHFSLAKIQKDFFGYNVVADISTPYNRAWIWEEQYPVAKKRTLSDGQSEIFIIPTAEGEDYVLPAAPIVKSFRLFEHFHDNPENMLMIGGAGYSLVKYVAQNKPELKIDVVEIDPSMLDIAKEYFYFEPNDNFRNIVQDGRVYLNQNEKKYDVIILDAFQDGSAIPFHLITREATQRVYNSLRSDGVFLSNTISSIQGEDSLTLRKQYHTLKDFFEEVVVIPINYPGDPVSKQNILLVALKDADKYKKHSADFELNEYLQNAWTEEIDYSDVLTDNHAPIEYYH